MFNTLYEQLSQHQNDDTSGVGTKTPIPSAKASRKRRRRKRKAKHSGSLESSSATVRSPQHQSKRRRRQAPSEEALALSAKLKELSSQKRLDEALELYWHQSNDSIRDEHHACIVVDCAARCGSIVEGEKVVAEMRKSMMNVNVETETALLKGYSHSGMIRKGATLFKGMCRSKDKRNRPNIRTLNTLLRGCLWTAVTAGGESQRLEGGILSGEESWNLFRSCVAVGDLDCSSYEYYVALLCYALRLDEAKEAVNEMKRKYDLTDDAKLNEAEPSVVESLAVSLVALARGMILLNQYDEAAEVTKRALHAADTAKQLLQYKQDKASHHSPGSTGGKRAWKRSEDSTAPRRAVSNSLFRSHRLSEVRSEASDLQIICRLRPKHTALADLAYLLMNRLLYFSGGGTTEQAVRQDDNVAPALNNSPSRVSCELFNSLWHSFGLRTMMTKLLPDADWVFNVNVFSTRELSLVQTATGSSSVLSDDGFVDFRQVFKSPPTAVAVSGDLKPRQLHGRPLDIEIGSGFGDWVVHQAICNPGRDYVAVELRADRVAQTFSKIVLNGSNSALSNVCCIGSECGSFLRKRVRHGSVARIFVNHPEPPTQTYGSNSHALVDIAESGDEPAHMLTCDTLISASRCLQESGRLIIVTDNRWYARLICVTLLKAMKRSSGLICSSELSGNAGFRRIETFGDSRGHVILYEGQPSEAIAHSVQDGKTRGTSYFDRLWRCGAGTHAERKKRFIISMEREQVPATEAMSTSERESRPYVHPTTKMIEPKNVKKNRKKSEAKQRRRNERRLAKREATKRQHMD